MTVSDFLDLAYRTHMVQSPTLDKAGLTRVTGIPYKKLLLMLKYQELPERLILGGYRERGNRSRVLFYTDEVLQWVKSEEAKRHFRQI